jgi:phosphoglycolate phosphatase-like HAD superfamily hydrolase
LVQEWTEAHHVTTATRHAHDRIAVMFDFDLTLAPSSLGALLRHCGTDPEAWLQETVNPLRERGWEEILATVFGLVALSRSGPIAITRDLLTDVGRALQPFDGVPAMFETLRRVAQEVEPALKVEFYVVSSGLADVMAETCIAGELDALWGTKLHFDEATGTLDFPMLIVTHPEKVRYILAVCKGLDPTGPNAPAHVYQDMPDEKWHVSLDQVVYVGDGSSDMAAFRLMNQRGGVAIGLYKTERAQDWPAMREVDPDRRLENLARADYREGSELMQSLQLAVESIARKAALRRLGRGE